MSKLQMLNRNVVKGCVKEVSFFIQNVNKCVLA